MSSRRRPARFLCSTLLGALVVLFVAPMAHAASPVDVCDEFPHKQTYVADEGLFRAPAWHFEKTVTIVYETASCVAEADGGTSYRLSIAGTALIYEGDSAEGALLEERPFTSEIRSRATDGRLGWPIDWWSCFDGRFSYVWTIEDVYIFAVTATDGRWLMAQRDPKTGESIARIADGCARSSD